MSLCVVLRSLKLTTAIFALIVNKCKSNHSDASNTTCSIPSQSSRINSPNLRVACGTSCKSWPLVVNVVPQSEQTNCFCGWLPWLICMLSSCFRTQELKLVIPWAISYDVGHSVIIFWRIKWANRFMDIYISARNRGKPHSLWLYRNGWVSGEAYFPTSHRGLASLRGDRESGHCY